MATKTVEEIWKEKNQFDFERLLEPYQEGGTQTQPVRRTMGTIVDYLLNKKRYNVDVAGAAILITFTELFKGKSFPGDGSYGSKGRELVTYIRQYCDKLNQKHQQDKVYAAIAGGRAAYLNEFIRREVALRTYPRWKKILCRKKWKILQVEYEFISNQVKNEPS